MKRRNFFSIVLAAVLGVFGFALGMRLPPTDKKEEQINQPKLTKKYQLRMVTSWPAGSPGTGTTAERLAERIQNLSQQAIRISIHPAGDLVGGLEVFDAVARGTVDMGHTASFFWQGKVPLSPFFTAVPFGLNPNQHHAWLYQGGGHKLWDELYRPFNLKPFAAGNTGPSMGGWFKEPLDFSAPRPFEGIKFRIPGLGGAVVKEMGALPLSLPPTEVFSALQSGVIDAAELLAPWNDRSFGLHKVAKHCYYPGFHEPNGSAEFLVNLKLYESLPQELRQVIIEASYAENLIGLAESDWHNAKAMSELRKEGVSFIAYPETLLKEMRETAEDVLIRLTGGTSYGRRLYKSYKEAQDITSSWVATKLR